jgi:hypothetical protein
MNRFAQSRDAKEFLIARIVREAQMERMPLSEVERKMLYFSETHWTLPDIWDVNDAFGRQYNSDEYESKIAQLIQNARARARKEDPRDFKAWSDAILMLDKEDHYLLVMIDQAGASMRPRGDLLRLWATGLAIVCIFVSISLVIPPSVSRESLGFFTWATIACAACGYSLLRLLLGGPRVDGIVDTIMTKVLKRVLRTK